MKKLRVNDYYGTPLYRKFHNIVQRCNNKKHPRYNNWGGRGIKCEWDSFDKFREGMENSFNEHVKKYGLKETTIERVDNNGNYCKENCVWATWKTQYKNRRKRKSEKKYLFNGNYLTVPEIKTKYNLKISKANIQSKIISGYTYPELVNENIRKIRNELRQIEKSKFEIPINFPFYKLTKRETRIYKLKSEGLSFKRIGNYENITSQRATQILKKIYEKVEKI